MSSVKGGGGHSDPNPRGPVIKEQPAASGFKGTKRSAPKKSRTQRKRGRKKAVETGKGMTKKINAGVKKRRVPQKRSRR